MNRLDPESARARLAALDLDDPAEDGANGSGYLRAAATLATFDPSQLRPAAGSEPGRLDELLRLCTPVEGVGWTLDETVRINTLTTLYKEDGVTTILAARAANPGGTSPAQHVLDAWLHGTVTDPATMTVDVVRAALQVHRWVSQFLWSVPSVEQLRSRLALVELLAPLERSAQTFFNRRRELADLHEYARRPGEVLPLVLHGPGGTGKSALIERFILDIARSEPPRPWAYIDFDSPLIDPNDPGTIVQEIVRQLGAQYPDFRRVTRSFHLDIQRSRRLTRRGGGRPPGDYVIRVLDELLILLDQVSPGQPLILAFDTFEEVQYRDDDTAARLVDYFASLGRYPATARMVIAGRAPEPGLLDMRIGGFSRTDAHIFLARLYPQDPVLLDEIIDAVGTLPLSLRLAAEVLRLQGAKGLRSVDWDRQLIGGVHEARVQGLLYRRILGHLHGDVPARERISRLAHGSLALRVLTPENVLVVLNALCDLQLSSIEDARDLLRELQREVAFVEPAPITGPDLDKPRLRHRPDLRGLLVPTLARSLGAERLLAIHTQAAQYYAQASTDPAAITEAVFHRLAAGESLEAMEPLLAGANRQSLLLGAAELPAKARASLFERFGGGVFEDATPELTQKQGQLWAIAAVEQRARALLVRSDPAGALQIVRELDDSPRSARIALIEARAHAALGAVDQAATRANAALRGALWQDDSRDLYEVALATSRLAVLAVDQRLELLRAAQASRRLTPPQEFHLAVRELAIIRRAGLDEGPRVEVLEKRLDDAHFSASDLGAHSELLIALAGTLGVQYPELVREALTRVGLGEPNTAQLRAIAAAFAAAAQDTRTTDDWYMLLASHGSRLADFLLDTTFYNQDHHVSAAILTALQDYYAELDACPPGQGVEAMTEDDKFLRLYRILVRAYYETGMFVSLMERCGVPASELRLDLPSEQAWFFALTQFRRRGLIGRLVDAVYADREAVGHRPQLAVLGFHPSPPPVEDIRPGATEGDFETVTVFTGNKDNDR